MSMFDHVDVETVYIPTHIDVLDISIFMTGVRKNIYNIQIYTLDIICYLLA